MTLTKKGVANIGTLIGILVFLLVVFVAALPVINSALITESTAINTLGPSTFSILITLPLFIVLGAVAIVAMGLLTG